MRVYISGKISGLPSEQVKAKFELAEQQVTAFGHEPVSPLKNGLNESEDWDKQMKADICMLFDCDGIYLLCDWQDSRGARIESAIAHEAGLKIMHQQDNAAYKS